MFTQITFQIIILMKLLVSLIYLAVNYITHTYQLPFSLANALRLFISCLDFVILLAIIFHYVCEWFLMAYGHSIIGILFSIFICALNWAILIRQDSRVQPVFIIGTFSLIALVVLYIQFFSMGLGYKGLISALFMYNIIYISCWLLFDPYAKTITRFMEHIGDHLSWIDPLIGPTPKEVALRNLCSFNVSLLNLTYIHTSGGFVNILILSLILLSLITNVLIGLRLIKTSASVKLETSFMLLIIKQGYSNIITIYEQLKNKHLPKATWYAWAMVLTIGLVFTSPSYAMSPNVNEGQVDMPSPFETDESQNQEIKTADSGQPIGESYWRRYTKYAKEFFDHNVDETIKRVRSAPAELLYTAGKTGAAAGVGIIGKSGYDFFYSSDGAVEEHGVDQRTNSNRPTYAQLLEDNQKKDETIQTQASIINKQNNSLIEKDRELAEYKNKAWFSWFKSCWKRSSD